MSKKQVQEVQEVQVQVKKVGQRSKDLILQGLSNKEVLEIIKAEYPAGKTSIACIAWYKSDLKKTKAVDNKPFEDWKKAQGFDEASLRTMFEASQVMTE